MKALRLIVRTVWMQAQQLLAPYELAGPPYIVPSGEQLLAWLELQPSASVRLLLLDYQVQGGTILQILPSIRSPAGTHHPALRDDAVLIGWSIHTDAAEAFRQAGGVDGFISKRRSVKQLIPDILHILAQKRQAMRWVEL